MKKYVIFLLIPIFFIGCKKEEPRKAVKKYTIDQFMNNVSIRGSSFSPDEKKILFTRNESGVYNAYEISINGGEPKQLTQREETTYAISYFPEDERILMMSDQGGNEIYHIYLRDQEGNIKDITPYEKARSSFAGWSHDRNSFFMASNKRNPK